MKLFCLLIFYLILASARADEEVTTVEDVITSTQPIFNINQDETTTVGKLFELENGNKDFEDATTEPTVNESEDFPDETTTVIPEAGKNNNDGVLLPDQLPVEEPRAEETPTTEEPLTTEGSLTSDAVTLAEQDGTTVIIPDVRSEDGNAPAMETESSPIPTINPEVKDKFFQIVRSVVENFSDGKPINWGEISSAVEPILRNGDISSDQAEVLKKLANRFLETINRASTGEKVGDDESVIRTLTELSKEAVDRMINDKSIGLTPGEGSLIKGFYDKAVTKMGEMKMELTTTPQTIITEQLPEVIPEEKVPEQVQEKADLTTVSPGNQEELKEDSTKPESDDQLKTERSESHDDEPESEAMDKDKLILLITVAAACSLLLLCGGMGLCCYMRKRARSGRSNFKA